MKKPTLIIAAGVVVIAFLLLVDKIFLTKESAQKTAATKQQESESVQQASQSEKKKATGKPASKPPVYDLSKKAHWYDPETTKAREGWILLSELLSPFHPTPEEFQIIAQNENSLKKLKESLSEDEYYSIEGRKRYLDESIKLNNQLREQLGEARYRFFAEVRDLETGYYKTWKVLTVNGISEERVSEFRELADEFNQQMYGYPLYRADRYLARYGPEDFDIDIDQQKQIAKNFVSRIEKEFGKQVLADIAVVGGAALFLDELIFFGDPMRSSALTFDRKAQERAGELYNFYEFISEEEGDKLGEEADRLAKRETELWEKWENYDHYHAQQWEEPEEVFGGSP